MDRISDIGSFYAGKSVLLTGGSGFLGKIALEKLLRATEVKRIYLLFRTKKEKDPQKRLEELFSGTCFEQLNSTQSNFKERVTLISGDCKLPNLGMSEEDREMIIKEVDVIIHFAATVRFDENLKTATAINVTAVRDLIGMARKMPKLKAFLHVSTAFAHCTRSDIDEIIYDTPIGGNQLITVMDALDEKMVAEITPKFLGEFPNTYTFTKAVAENLIRSEGKGLPIAIFRPSIVVSSYKEPVPGWIDTYYGATGVVMGSALGLIRIIQCVETNRSEIVPADYVANAAIAATWETSLRSQEEEEIPVYNFVSSPKNPLTWLQYMELGYKHCSKIPSPMVIWHYVLFLTNNPLLFKIGFFLLHYVPAYIIDFIALLIGRKPTFVKIYEKIDKFSGLVSYFNTRQWNFTDTNVQSLWQKLSKDDKDRFEFDMATFDWDAFVDIYMRGCRQYLLKDTLDSIPEGKKKLFRLKIFHYSLCGFLLLALFQIMYIILKSVL